MIALCKAGHEREVGKPCRSCARARRAEWSARNFEKERARLRVTNLARYHASRIGAVVSLTITCPKGHERPRATECKPCLRLAGAAWRAKNAVSCSAKASAKYEANKETLLAKSAAYKKANRRRYAIHQQKRRALEVNAPGSFTEAEFQVIVAAQGRQVC